MKKSFLREMVLSSLSVLEAEEMLGFKTQFRAELAKNMFRFWINRTQFKVIESWPNGKNEYLLHSGNITRVGIESLLKWDQLSPNSDAYHEKCRG